MADFVEYEYKKDWGDHLLALIKKIFRSAEFRHHTLPWLARFAAFVPKPKVLSKPSLDYEIRFKDGSIPIFMNGPVMLAAGSVKYGEAIPSFAKIGFGAVTVGTVTLDEREGNPYRPRVALLEADEMMQNSMGLNNPGIDVLASIVDRDLIKAHKQGVCVGLSVAETPGINDPKERIADLMECFRKAYSAADYLEINLSCPNTGHDRIDTQWEYLEKLLEQIKEYRRLAPVRKAVYAKLSPDLSEESLHAMLGLVQDYGLNGVVLFNTFPGAKARFLNMKTKHLEAVRGDGDLGGLSGRPLYINTARAVQWVKEHYPELSILASGGIDCGAKAYDLIEAGADAVQLYSVLGFRWMPALKVQVEMQKVMREKGVDHIDQLRQGLKNHQW